MSLGYFGLGVWTWLVLNRWLLVAGRVLFTWSDWLCWFLPGEEGFWRVGGMSLTCCHSSRRKGRWFVAISAFCFSHSARHFLIKAFCLFSCSCFSVMRRAAIFLLPRSGAGCIGMTCRIYRTGAEIGTGDGDCSSRRTCEWTSRHGKVDSRQDRRGSSPSADGVQSA
jgi:hypothetical protein